MAFPTLGSHASTFTGSEAPSLEDRAIERAIVELSERPRGCALIVRVIGSLTTVDFETFVPEIERVIQQGGRLRMLIELHGFDGWDVNANWRDVDFDVSQLKHVERLAIVGDPDERRHMTAFLEPFTETEIHCLGHHELNDAKSWIFEGLN